jgi:hypothetical protein
VDISNPKKKIIIKMILSEYLKNKELISLQKVNDTLLSVLTSDGYSRTIDVDITNLIGQQVQTTTDFTINNNILTVDGVEYNMYTIKVIIPKLRD